MYSAKPRFPRPFRQKQIPNSSFSNHTHLAITYTVFLNIYNRRRQNGNNRDDSVFHFLSERQSDGNPTSGRKGEFWGEISAASRSKNQEIKKKKEKSLADRQHTTKPATIDSTTWGTEDPKRRTETELRIRVPRTTAQHTVALPAGIPIEAPFTDISGQIVEPVLIDSKTPYWSGAVIGITVSIDIG